jgi:Caudovirus prohead serine protease
MSAGAINGYGVLWDDISHDFSEPDHPPRYERIVKGALKIADNAVACVNHARFASFAFKSDGSLEFGSDDTGLWFRATLPETAAGYGIRNSLTGGRCIGASVEFVDRAARYDAYDGIETVISATVVGIALIARPIYPQTRAWLSGDIPNERQAAALHASFAFRQRRRAEPVCVPEIPAAMKNAMMMARR